MEIFETVSHPSKKIDVFQVEDNIALISSTTHHEIGTNGIFTIKVIAGFFEILGYMLTPNSSIVEVCSTKEHSVKIKPLPLNRENNEVLNQSYLISLGIPENVIEIVLANFTSVDYLLMVTVIERSAHFMKYIGTYVEFPIFFNKKYETPVISHISGDVPRYNTINIRQEWNSLGSTLTKGSKRVVLSGGKGVGKSTLLRYLVNKSLASGHQALILDFDPGQAEFTVMGCISAVLVTKPLLGPNFSHLVSPIKSIYLGSISVSNYSKQYLDGVKKIIELCMSTKPYHDIPWFINTMGFTKGLGVTLLKEIILNVQPTDVIQINAKNKLDNFPERLTPGFILNQNDSFQSSLNYTLHVLPSASKNSSISFDPVTWGLNPVRKRGLVALSYFFNMLQNESLNFLECLPYKINIKNLNIIIATNDTPIELANFHKLSCINGNMVALCYSENNSEFIDCLGFGIVRGIDFETEEVFIITPLNESELERVNVIHMNPAIQLPKSVLKNQSSVVQNVLPYVAQVFPSRLNQLIKRSTSRIRPYSLGKNV